jgi:hypothetical protein
VTQDSPLPERQDRRHPPAFIAEPGMPDCVNTTMKTVKTSSVEALRDAAGMNPDTE